MIVWLYGTGYRKQSMKQDSLPAGAISDTLQAFNKDQERMCMNEKKPVVYPTIPNSVPAVKQAMLKAVGAESVDEFYEDVPEKLRLPGKMDLPEPLLSEYALRRHVEGLLAKNSSCQEYLSFLRWRWMVLSRAIDAASGESPSAT